MELGALESLGYNTSEVFKDTFLPLYNGYWVQRCIIFDPYMNVTPTIQGQVSHCFDRTVLHS
jgi:hypothetical protein